jgi:hypothetical protein
MTIRSTNKTKESVSSATTVTNRATEADPFGLYTPQQPPVVVEEEDVTVVHPFATAIAVDTPLALTVSHATSDHVTSVPANHSTTTHSPYVQSLNYTTNATPVKATAYQSLSPSATSINKDTATWNKLDSYPTEKLQRMKRRRKRRTVIASVTGGAVGFVFLGPLGLAIGAVSGAVLTKATGKAREKRVASNYERQHGKPTAGRSVPAHRATVA